MQGLGYVLSTPQGVTLPEDATRWEANRAKNERQRRQFQSAVRAATRARGWGEETPSEPESSGDGDEEEDEDEEEGEIIPSVPCSPPDIIPSLDDLFSQIGGDLRWRALGEMPSGGNRGIFRATTTV
jgi:hypothetical protein